MCAAPNGGAIWGIIGIIQGFRCCIACCGGARLVGMVVVLGFAGGARGADDEVAAGAVGGLWSVFILLSMASISRISSSCSAASKKSVMSLSPLLFPFTSPVKFVRLEVVLLVPATCLEGQSRVRHSRALSDCWHIFGWNSLHLLPFVQPRGPRFPCCIRALQAGGCRLGHPFPLMPCRQVPFL